MYSIGHKWMWGKYWWLCSYMHWYYKKLHLFVSSWLSVGKWQTQMWWSVAFIVSIIGFNLLLNQKFRINSRWRFKPDLKFLFVCSFCLISLSDINECSLNTDHCAQHCTNTVGSYYCSCRTGYRLSSNGRSCSGMLFKLLEHHVIIQTIMKLASPTGYIMHDTPGVLWANICILYLIYSIIIIIIGASPSEPHINGIAVREFYIMICRSHEIYFHMALWTEARNIPIRILMPGLRAVYTPF